MRTIIFIFLNLYVLNCSIHKEQIKNLEPRIQTNQIYDKATIYDKNRKVSSYETIEFFVQPYEGVRISLNIDSLKINPSPVEKDMGKFIVKIPIYEDGLGVELTLKKDGYENITRLIRTKNDLHSRVFFFQKNSFVHKFWASVPCGKEPKSVRFINSSNIVVGLLDEEGFDWIDLNTLNAKRYNIPPENNPRRLGFVESLLLANRNEIWFSQMKTATIHVFDMNNFSYKTMIPLSGEWTKVMEYDDKRNLVYASNWKSKNISIVDVQLHKELRKTKELKGVPRGMLISEDREKLYFAQFSDKEEKGGGRVGIYSIQNETVETWMGTPGSKRHIVKAPKKNQIYVSDMLRSVVELFDIQEKKELASIRVYDNPNTIALSPDGKYLYVSCRGPNNQKTYLKKGPSFGKIFVIDTDTNTVKESWDAGNQPTGLDISPDGRFLATSDFLDHRIRIYERTDLNSKEVSLSQ